MVGRSFLQHSTTNNPHSTLLLSALLSRRAGIGGGDAGLFADHLIADAVGHGLLGVEEAVALGILADLVDALAGALGHDADERVLGLEDFLRLNFDVGGLSIHAAEGLVD